MMARSLLNLEKKNSHAIKILIEYWVEVKNNQRVII